MSSSGPLLVEHHGIDGHFSSWLKKIGLEDVLRDYPLEKLVSWGWMRPQYRIVFPGEFFTSWTNFPECPAKLTAEHRSLSLLWESNWWTEESDGPLWFLNPFFRPGDPSGLLLNAASAQGLAPVPEALTLPSGESISPYADYFYPWQAYALIDVVRTADNLPALLNTPDLTERIDSVSRIAAWIKDSDPRSILDLPRRWGGLAEPFTWIAHFDAFRKALPVQNGRVDFAQLKRGALGLAAHFGIDENSLAAVIKDRLLVLAQDWRWANDRHCVWTQRAWPYLTLDIETAVEWLCVISGRTLDYYLNEWQYPHLGQELWAELHEVLPYEFFVDRAKFLANAPHYLEDLNSHLPLEERLEGQALAKRVDQLRAAYYPFVTLLGAFRQLHEELAHRYDPDGSIDFRELRPLDHYSLLAFRVEVALRERLDRDGALATGNLGEKGLSAFIAARAAAIGLPRPLIDRFSREAKPLTNLRPMPTDPIQHVMKLETGLPAKDDYLVRAFLCCVLARNYFAHHTYLDSSLLSSQQSAFMLGGVLATALMLL